MVSPSWSALEVDEVDVGGQVGEEHVAAAGAPHQRHAFAGQMLLDELADAAGALPLELDISLVGHHGALPHHHLAVERDLQHLAVLQLHARLRGLGLGILRGKQVAAHGDPFVHGDAIDPSAADK